MWTIIKYYILTKNNFFMLILFYPIILTSSKMGGVYIAPAMSNLDIIVYPFLYFGFFVNTDKAELTRLPINLEEIRLSESIALYLIVLFLFIQNVILLGALDILSLTAVESSFFRVNVMFALALLFSKLIFNQYFDFMSKEFLSIPIKMVPLVTYILLSVYVFPSNVYAQLILAVFYFPCAEIFDFYRRKKLRMSFIKRLISLDR